MTLSQALCLYTNCIRLTPYLTLLSTRHLCPSALCMDSLFNPCASRVFPTLRRAIIAKEHDTLSDLVLGKRLRRLLMEGRYSLKPTAP